MTSLQNTFTSTSDNPLYDEKNFADIIIEKSNVKSFFVTPTGDSLITDYEKLIFHQEEPFISTSIYAGFCVSRLVKDSGITLTMDGQGPDEMMGGYNPYLQVLTQNLLNFELIDFLRNFNGYRKNLGLSESYLLRTVLSNISSLISKKFDFQSNIFSDSSFDRIVNKNIRTRFDIEGVVSKNCFDDYSKYSIKTSPLPGILKQVDRNSMAFSTESRLPFLDYRLVEFIHSLPNNQKVNSGLSKYIYRNSMKGILPEEIRMRKSKLGFATAEESWLKGNFGDVMTEVFNSIQNDSIINKNSIIKRFNDFRFNNGQFSSYLESF